MMAFKCYCPKCDTPLYFEEAVPMPQICFSCLSGQVECDYPRCLCPRFGRCPKLSRDLGHKIEVATMITSSGA